jgi:DNA-binding PadR family transcriptional regulator
LHYYVTRSSLSVVNDPGLLILTSLSSGPKHGHALLLDIDAFAGVRLGPGTLYGAITRLEERGLIEPLDAEARRRPYRLTGAGTAELAASLADMRRVVETATTRLAAAT